MGCGTVPSPPAHMLAQLLLVVWSFTTATAPRLPSGASYASWRPTRPEGPPLPLAVVSSHRDFVLGCHSFSRFLDPRWETLYVFEREFAARFGLDRLLRHTSAAESRGVHLVTLSRAAGEQRARQIALEVLFAVDPAPELLVSWNCDIHPLPPWHAQHVPSQTMIARMAEDFHTEAALRRNGGGRTQVFSAGDVKRANAIARHAAHLLAPMAAAAETGPLFAMTPVIWETLPSATDLCYAEFHGVNVGRTLLNGRCGRPGGLAPGIPWLADNGIWCEDHVLIFNASLLGQVLPDVLRAADAVFEGPRLMPHLLAPRGWATVLHGDLHTLFHLGKQDLHATWPNGTNSSLFDPGAYADVDYDWLRAYSLSVATARLSPEGCFREVRLIKARLGFDVSARCGFLKRHLRTDSLPAAPVDGALSSALPLVRTLLAHEGYRELRRNSTVVTFVQLPLYHAYNVRVGGKMPRWRPPFLVFGDVSGRELFVHASATHMAEGAARDGAARPLRELDLPLTARVVHIAPPVANLNIRLIMKPSDAERVERGLCEVRRRAAEDGDAAMRLLLDAVIVDPKRTCQRTR